MTRLTIFSIPQLKRDDVVWTWGSALSLRIKHLYPTAGMVQDQPPRSRLVEKSTVRFQDAVRDSGEHLGEIASSDRMG